MLIISVFGCHPDSKNTSEINWQAITTYMPEVCVDIYQTQTEWNGRGERIQWKNTFLCAAHGWSGVTFYCAARFLHILRGQCERRSHIVACLWPTSFTFLWPHVRSHIIFFLIGLHWQLLQLLCKPRRLSANLRNNKMNERVGGENESDGRMNCID